MAGDHRGIMIPSLEGFRSSSVRFKGLRLIHTHLTSDGISLEDLTDLAMLRLDCLLSIEVGGDGLPGRIGFAHLVPENPEGTFWQIYEPAKPAQLEQNFLAFIQALEEEFARSQRIKEVDSRERALLVRVETDPRNDASASLEELKELARSSSVSVLDSIIQRRSQLDPRYLMGKGKLADVVIRALQMGANLLVFDHELTPAQIRSVADFTELKVLDRTQIILDIFARRALSREGKIQVELAQLKYRLPRLVKRDSALSRLAGGIGGVGPGETKLEIDRRRVRQRIHHLEREIEGIVRARDLRREMRGRAGLPIISIVGYTNAGKSTLLNALTGSAVYTEDLLFATLDPKSSRLRFPRDTEAVITDTVGFIKDLPRELFAAFRATLDELKEADVLLHVIDGSNPRFEEQIRSVERIIAELELAHKPMIRVLNKEDLMPEKALVHNLCLRYKALAVSALAPETLRPLIRALEGILDEKEDLDDGI